MAVMEPIPMVKRAANPYTDRVRQILSWYESD